MVKTASARGDRIWLVGGAARDLLLGHPVVELDVAAAGDTEALARAMEEAGLGRSVLLSAEAPRVFRIAGRRQIDLAEVAGGSIRDDLGRRDFTVNAIALELPGLVWLDPFGGVPDLARGRLRMLSERNLSEDPIRVLRAARLIATHGLRPDGETSRACRRQAASLPRAAPERVRAEVVRLLEAREVAPALRWARGAGVLAPALGIEAGAAQRLAHGLWTLDSAPIRRSSPERRRRLRLAWICARLRLSPRAAARWLAARRFSREEAGNAAALLELVLLARAAKSSMEQWKWVRKSGGRWKDVLSLLLLLHPRERARARRLGRRAAGGRRRPLIRGADLLLWLGIAPGPAVGALLEEVEIEVLRGAVRSRREARAWLLERAQRGPVRSAVAQSASRRL